MATQLGEAFVRITARLDELRRGLDEAKRMTTSAVVNIGNALSGLRSTGTAISLFVGAPVALAAKHMLDLGVSASETSQKIGKVFGDSATSIRKWSSTVGDAIGQSDLSLQKSASEFGTLIRAMGGTTGEAARLSKQAVEAAADLAAFKDVGLEDTLGAVRAALIQGGRGLQQFGINLAGLENAGQSLDVVRDRLAAMLVQMRRNGAVGEAVDEMNNLAGQMARLRAELNEAAAAIGGAFAPAVRAVVKFFNDWIAPIFKVIAKIIEFSTVLKIVVGVLGLLAIVMGPILVVTGTLASAVVNLYLIYRIARFEMDSYSASVARNTVIVSANVAATRSLALAQTTSSLSTVAGGVGGALALGGAGRAAGAASAAGAAGGLIGRIAGWFAPVISALGTVGPWLLRLGGVLLRFAGWIGIAITAFDLIRWVIGMFKDKASQTAQTISPSGGGIGDIGIAGGSLISGSVASRQGGIAKLFSGSPAAVVASSGQKLDRIGDTLDDIRLRIGGNMGGMKW